MTDGARTLRSAGPAVLRGRAAIIAVLIFAGVPAGTAFGGENPEEESASREQFVAGDAEAGARVFRRCAGCHALTAGAQGKGPHLYGLFGRPAGSLAAFDYSDAMKKTDIVWTEETLSAFLAHPRRFAPGTRMATRMRDREKRADLIAYLKHATKEAVE
ncbi:MAG: c-type cytochrome [Pseudomonadota bacterium]